MHEDSMRGLSIGRLFGVSNAPHLRIRPVREAVFSVTYLECRVDVSGSRVVNIPKQDCFFLMLYLDDTRHCDLMPDGRESAIMDYHKGSLCLVDLAEGASIRLYDTLRSLAFLIPRALLAEVSEFSNAPGARNLRGCRGAYDNVMGNLGGVLLPLLQQQHSTPSPVLGHVAVAICAHLLHRYGDTKPQNQRGPAFSAMTKNTEKDSTIFTGFSLEDWRKRWLN